MEPTPLIPRGPGNPARRIMRRLGNRPARRHAVRIMFMVAPWRREGMTVAECAALLNGAGELTFRGRRWTAPNLSRILAIGRVATLDATSPLDPDDERAAVRRAVFPDAHRR